MKLKLLLAILLFASTAEARTYQIDIIMAHGPAEISRQDAIVMAAFTRAKFRLAGISIRFGRISFVKNLVNPQYNLSNYMNGVFWWQRHLPPRTNIIRHVITPPFMVNGVYYIAGVSPGVCLVRWKYAVATSNAEVINQKNEDRFWQSAVALTHEQGHIFGAQHVIDHSIMNIGALAFTDPYTLQFSPTSAAQMIDCIHRK